MPGLKTDGRETVPLDREPGLRITGMCPRNVPEPPSPANDRHQQQPVPSACRPSDRQKAAWERILATADLTVYLAETGAEAVGTASMLLMPHLTYDCRPTAFIEAVVVGYAHSRRGVATLLLQQALKDAHAASCRKVQLLSHKRHSHDGAHDLYRAMGFTPRCRGLPPVPSPLTRPARHDHLASLVPAVRRH